ncbi:MAG TPA: hypothetical protein VMZ33_06400 [Candidatus Limnocylindrales bacterium]|nr:hypothetical protein [Candidatus Limnocylindrales bacterium]
MPDVEKILRLVAEGTLTAEEADEILSALRPAEQPASPPAAPQGTSTDQKQSRHLRIEVTERGRQVVNLRVPVNVAAWASHLLPGLSDENAQRIRSAIDTGSRGPILEVNDDDGATRVLIVSE